MYNNIDKNLHQINWLWFHKQTWVNFSEIRTNLKLGLLSLSMLVKPWPGLMKYKNKETIMLIKNTTQIKYSKYTIWSW